MVNKIKYIITGVVVAILILGFYLTYKSGYRNGVASVDIDEGYHPIYPIHDTIRILIPDSTQKPIRPILPTKADTCWRDSIVYITQVVDTAAILEDYLLKRYYKNTLFSNDTLGTLVVGFETQYNKSSNLWYDFTPVRKVVVYNKDKDINHFRILGGIGTNNFFSSQLQYKFNNNFVIGYQFVRKYDIDLNSHMLTIGYDF